MKRRLVLMGGAAAAATMLGGCASQNLDAYSSERPELDLRRYFNGRLTAYGIFQDRSGQVVRRFTVVMDCRWDGDQGVLDDDGYLRVTGRLKEIINLGGEKISPLEVDDVLMDHPAVAQVVTFAMPHDKLGEEVAAAIVLREGIMASESDIRTFASSRLADFKVPRKIVILDEIPKGATGKLQRIGLAAKLGLA